MQFRLREHLERLYASIKYVRIPLEMSIEEMEQHIFETMEANNTLFTADDEHRLMMDVLRKTLSIYQGIVDAHKGPNVIITDFPLRWTTTGMGKLFDIGINAVITSQRAVPAWLLEPKVKSRSCIHYLLANIVEPAGFRKLVGVVRKIEKAMGDGNMTMNSKEIPIAKKLRSHIPFESYK